VNDRATMNAAQFNRIKAVLFDLGVAPQQACCFVGDHLTIDVAGAEAAELRGIWKRTSNWAPVAPVATIETTPGVHRDHGTRSEVHDRLPSDRRCGVRDDHQRYRRNIGVQFGNEEVGVA